MHRKILIADDNVATQTEMHRLLLEQGYEVITVGNGDLAIEKMHEFQPHGKIDLPDEAKSLTFLTTALPPIEEWLNQSGFFRSEFTHPNGAVRLTSHPQGFFGLWKSLKNSERAFPVGFLTEANETVIAYGAAGAYLDAAGCLAGESVRSMSALATVVTEAPSMNASTVLLMMFAANEAPAAPSMLADSVPVCASS